jgi:hypothetical protein
MGKGKIEAVSPHRTEAAERIIYHEQQRATNRQLK